MTTDNGSDRNWEDYTPGWRTDADSSKGRAPDSADGSSGSEEYQRDGSEEGTSPETAFTREDWENLPSNPDTADDFGYGVSEWNSFETPDNTDQVMFMPADESLIMEDAFIVAEERVMCELGERC